MQYAQLFINDYTGKLNRSIFGRKTKRIQMKQQWFGIVIAIASLLPVLYLFLSPLSWWTTKSIYTKVFYCIMVLIQIILIVSTFIIY